MVYYDLMPVLAVNAFLDSFILNTNLASLLALVLQLFGCLRREQTGWTMALAISSVHSSQCP